MEEREYYDKYEERLQEELVKLCSSHGVMDGRLLESPDLDEKWAEMAPDYMADSVGQINAFPAAAIAWAGYVGMAVAHWWDEDWATNSSRGYEELHGVEGFDDMDEHIMRDILGIKLESEQAERLENLMRSCAHAAMSMIRNEEVESQSTKAFYIFARTERVMFKVGASVELKRLGYRLERAGGGDVS